MVQQQEVETQAEIGRRLDEQRSADAAISQSQAEVIRLRQHIRRLARFIYVQPDSMLVVLAKGDNAVDALHNAVDMQILASEAKSDHLKLHQEEQRIQDLGVRKGQAQQAEQQARQRLQLLQVRGIGLDLWNRIRSWQAANPDVMVDPNPSHSETPLAAPLPGSRLTQGFGPSSLWLEPPFGGYAHFHTGLDLSAPYGSAVLSADDGIVIEAASDGYGYGNYAVVGHTGGRATLYAHLSRVVVRAGDRVAQGQAVGFEGSTGNSTGPHLHFEVLIDGQPVSPKDYLPAS